LPNAKEIGAKLRKLRGTKTRRDVAEACGVSVSALMMYENGARIPRDEIKVRLANYYHRSVGGIFFE
jgi:putative transcriptional regulator